MQLLRGLWRYICIYPNIFKSPGSQHLADTCQVTEQIICSRSCKVTCTLTNSKNSYIINNCKMLFYTHTYTYACISLMSFESQAVLAWVSPKQSPRQAHQQEVSLGSGLREPSEGTSQGSQTGSWFIHVDSLEHHGSPWWEAPQALLRAPRKCISDLSAWVKHSHPTAGCTGGPRGCAGGWAGSWVCGTNPQWLLPGGLPGRGGRRGPAEASGVVLVAGAPPGLTHRAETPGRSTHMPPRGLWTQLCCDTGEGLEAQVVGGRRVAALTSAVWWYCWRNSCRESSPSEKGSVANRLEKGWVWRPNRGHDHHVPKIKQELDRLEQSGNFPLTSASAQPHPRQPADTCQLWSGFWFLGSFVLSLGDASDASYRDAKRT